MNKLFKKALKCAQEITDTVEGNDFTGVTEDNLEYLAEAIDLLNIAYDRLYDEVFVTLEDE
jgi:hypothetical protein